MPANGLASLRRSRGLSQAALADRLKITPAHLSRMERGKVEIKEYMEARIIWHLDLSSEEVSDLIGWPRLDRAS